MNINSFVHFGLIAHDDMNEQMIAETKKQIDLRLKLETYEQ